MYNKIPPMLIHQVEVKKLIGKGERVKANKKAKTDAAAGSDLLEKR